MNKKRTLWQLLSILAVLVVIAVLIILWFASGGTVETIAKPLSSARPGQLEKSDGPRFVEEKHNISVEVITDGLRDMGTLITQEYYFTDIISYSESLTLFKGINLPFTESSYIAGYNGVVTAGIDFRKIDAAKDDAEKTLTLFLPKASVQNVDIDYDSFVMYSEKNGIGTKISFTDMNSSLVELKKKVKNDAADRGVLEKADENAAVIVRNFAAGVLNDPEYSIVIKTK